MGLFSREIQSVDANHRFYFLSGYKGGDKPETIYCVKEYNHPLPLIFTQKPDAETLCLKLNNEGHNYTVSAANDDELIKTVYTINRLALFNRIEADRLSFNSLPLMNLLEAK